MKIVNREAMEAHLLLQGWTPCSYGTIGARKGGIVWYMYRAWDRSKDADPLDRETKFGHTLLAPDQIEKHDLDMWFWSDELFWPFARYLQHDAVRIKTESVNGAVI